MSEPKTYEFATLRELFNRVPADRMEACCADLGRSMARRSVEQGDVDAVLPDKWTWIDDSKGEITINLHDDGAEQKKPLMRIQSTPVKKTVFAFTPAPEPKEPTNEESI